jgi:hypothetical protein
MGKMIFTVLAAVAELERSVIAERVYAGVNRARKEGKTFGRPKIIVDREKVRQLHQAGESLRAIATQMGLTKSTVFNIVNANGSKHSRDGSKKGDDSLFAPRKPKSRAKRGPILHTRSKHLTTPAKNLTGYVYGYIVAKAYAQR